MSASAATPCSMLFSTMKKLGGISYKELDGLILSGKPLSDGKSPVSRINDRTWVSRFIVHAPAGSLQDKYFCDFGIGALRVVSRLRSKEGRGLTSEQVLDLVCGPEGSSMVDALKACRQDVSLYRNIVTRLVKGGRFTVDERAEIAMVLFLTAGCTADVQRAAQTALDFSQSVHGARLATPATASPIEAQGERDAVGLPEPLLHLQLLRIVDGYVAGGPYWVPPTREGSEIGALALGDSAIADVGAGVSSHHLRIWRDAEGAWLAEGLCSRNGSVLRSGATLELTVIEPPRDEREGFVSVPVEIRPGDELLLADDTVFLVLEGMPSDR